jgi:hypothetical protein
VRFLAPDYVPQLQETTQHSTLSDPYLLIGSDWVEEDALRLAGIEHHFLAAGFWILDPDIGYVRLNFSLTE